MDQIAARRLADMALDQAERLGASYADVRLYLDDAGESFVVKDDVLESAFSHSDSGAGIRVLVNGAWGFASFSDLSRGKSACESEMSAAVSAAAALARASARLRAFPIELAPLSNVPQEAEYETPYEIDPFAVPAQGKIALLRDLNAALSSASDLIAIRTCGMRAGRTTKLFAATERGQSARRYATQTIRECALSVSVVAIDGNEMQERALWGFDGFAKAGGFETVLAVDKRAVAERHVAEALELIAAPECEPGVTDIIVAPEHLALHVHETGHGFEGDRLLGYEQTYVGNTFINELLDHVGSHQFASQAVNIVADATAPGGYGTFAFDDEGVPGQRFFLVERGTLMNVLTSRETVSQINQRVGRELYRHSNGTMRASAYTRMPLIRMTNISLLPGEATLADLIGRVDRGLLLEGTTSWSMSEDRKNFDFGVQLAREIKNGRLGRVVRNAGYTGSNLAFWQSCEAVAGEDESFVLNVPNCGKGQPGQSMSTGHQASPALFRGVQVYNRKQRGGA